MDERARTVLQPSAELGLLGHNFNHVIFMYSPREKQRPSKAFAT